MSRANLADSLYRRLFFDAPVHGIVALDATGVVAEVNPVAARLLGVAPDAAAGREIDWLLEVLGVDGSAADTLQRLRGGAVVAVGGWVVPERRGSPRWCEGTVAALTREGEVSGFVAVLHDATQARHRRFTPPESEARFAAALAHTPVAVFEQDRELRYVWVPAPMPRLGVPDPEQALGRTDRDVLAPEAAERLEAVKRRVLASGATERAEVALPGEDGEVAFDLTAQPLRDTAGDVVGVRCAAVDVTERRRAEHELRRSRALLAEAEHLARMGSWEWDIAEDRILWSDGLYEIYGLTPETFDSRFAAREQRVHPDDRERVDAAVAGALADGGEIDIEYRILRPDGRVRRVHGRAEVMVDAEGRPVRMAGTAQDVTEVRAAEEALEQTAAELGRRAAELHRVTRHAPAPASDIGTVLGERQLEILGLIADGFGNAEIASRLYLSEATVKWHVRQILRKLRVANRAEAVARYVRSGRSSG